MQRRCSKASILGLLAATCLTGLAARAAAEGTVAVPNPTVVPVPAKVAPGDPSHDYVFLTPAEKLSDYGYVEEEFFLEGTASRYNTPTGATGTSTSAGHPYRTRIVVRRPATSERFNGTVLLEWQNVTAGYDIDAHWGPSWRHIVDRGYAWVGVSAQRVGVHGSTAAPPPAGTPAPAIPPTNNGLKAWSPLRYGTLDVTAGGTVTDDSLSYDIFSQAAQSVRSPGKVNPLGDLKPKLVLAVGASQSAGRLSIYHNSIHPLHQVVDGYYLLVGGAGLRTDLSVKVFQYLSETDVRPTRRMADSDHFRSWEITGAAHSSYFSEQYRSPLIDRDFGTDVWPATCTKPPFSRVRGPDVINAQYDLLVRWIVDNVPPPNSPKIEFSTSEPPTMVRDERGFARGGIRLPDIEAPIALHTGVNSGSTFCGLYGSYEPFDAATLKALYPDAATYVAAVKKSAEQNVAAGYILPKAAEELVRAAENANVPPR